MKLECPKCAAKGDIDDAKIPDTGAQLRCPRCSETFFAAKQRIEQPGTSRGAINPSSSLDQPLQMEQPRVIEETRASEPVANETTHQPPPSFQESCSLCKKTLSRMDMIRFGDSWVCAGCKPNYLQMLRQGLQKPGELCYAGFWIRFAAKVLDGLAVSAISFLVSLPFAFAGAGVGEGGAAAFANVGIGLLAQLILPAAYTVFFIGRYRATPGKMACGLVVVTADNGNVSYTRALGRHFSELLSSLILCIGYLMIAFDDQKRSLHDRICDTRVVRR